MIAQLKDGTAAGPGGTAAGREAPCPAADAPDGRAVAPAPGRRPVIFIAHPSDLLTDHQPNGDGLIAHGFIRTLAARGYRLHVAARKVDLAQALPPNVTLYPIPSGDGLGGRLRYMIGLRRLLARLRRTEPIGIVHQLNPVFTGLSLALLGCGLPLVLGTFVARWPDEPRRRGVGDRIRGTAASLARRTISAAQQMHASALLMTTPAATNRITFPALLRGRMFTVRHAIDAQLFSPAEGWQEKARRAEPSILFYAHLDRRKGVFVLIDAFRIVAEAIPECRLTLAGRGDHAAEVERKVAASGLGHLVTMTGRVERAQASALFRSHSVYCLPSFGEPYGTTLLEAMACARPAVVTDAGALPHVLPKEGGLCVPAGDPGALAAALIALLRSPERRVAMGTVNREFVEGYCTWEKVVDDLERVYDTVLQRQQL